MKRRAFLGLLAGAAAAKALAPLMPLVPTVDAQAAALAEMNALLDEWSAEPLQLRVSMPEMFTAGNLITISGDNRVYEITSVHGSMLRIDESMQDIIADTQPYKRPVKPRTHPKHFRAKQREPWFSFA